MPPVAKAMEGFTISKVSRLFRLYLFVILLVFFQLSVFSFLFSVYGLTVFGLLEFSGEREPDAPGSDGGAEVSELSLLRSKSAAKRPTKGQRPKRAISSTPNVCGLCIEHHFPL